MAREVLFWPGMRKAIEDMCNSCSTCAKYGKTATKEPMRSLPIPTLPWQLVSQDIFTHYQRAYLATVCHFSDWIEVDKLDDISTTTIINKTKAHFARFGVPCIFHRENGPQFTSQEYAEFAAHYRFKHTTSSPYHSQRNGKAEAAVKVSESILKKSDDLQTALLNHRNTPPKGRRTRTTLPTPDHLLEPTTIHTDTVIEEIKTKRSTSKTYYDKSAGNAHDTIHIGEFVYAQPPPRQHGKPWTYGRVTEQRHPCSYTIKTPHSTIRRNRVHIRRAAPPLNTTTTLTFSCY